MIAPGCCPPNVCSALIRARHRDETPDTHRRYHVNVDDEIMALKPANCRLQSGTCVRLFGLSSKPALNGTRGDVKGWDGGAERYLVHLSGGSQIKARAENLRA